MMNQNRKNLRFYLALIVFGLVGQVAWVVENMYLNVFLYKMFHASAEQISWMVAASAVTATVTTILIGALSDKLGKRKLFICAGYMFWGISILGFALIRVDGVHNAIFSGLSHYGQAVALCITLTIVLDCVMTFFGSAANDAAFNAWLTDATDETNRGAIEGVNAMMPLVAILVVFGGFMSLNQDLQESWTVIFCVIGGVVLLLGIAGIFLVRETAVKTSENASFFANIFYAFCPSVIRGNLPLYGTLVALALFNISIQIFMPYLILYYQVSLGISDYVLIFAPAIVVAAAFTGLYGKMFDKKGFRVAIIPPLVMLACGYVGLYFFRGMLLVFLASLVMMCGYLGTGAMIGAQIRAYTPEKKAGMFQGIRIVGQVLIPGVIGPAIGARILRNAETILNTDGTTSFVPNEDIFLGALVALLFTTVALVLLFVLLKKQGKEHCHGNELMTKHGEALLSSRQVPWTVYPRPQMRRDSYLNLNGCWDFHVNYENMGQILVPFCPESKLSGFAKHFEEGALLQYSRSFELPEGFRRDRVLLHIGAADQRADVFLNGKPVGSHRGGYEAFCVDITDALTDHNRLSIFCTDDLQDQSYPYGKQTMHRGGMWYTPVSGIWQSVWLESVPQNYIRKLNIENIDYRVRISIEPKLDGKVSVAGLGEFPLVDGTVTISPEAPQLWSPENPYLYDFTVETLEDRVESYFAIRSLEVKTVGKYPRLCLNGAPYFFHGLLDQGYWPDGIFTPAEPQCYAEEILAMKKLGFNTLRKHIKVEPEEFYYQCDRLGMIVFQDMVNNGPYSFFRDTVLPTIGIQKLNDRKRHNVPSTRKKFLEGMAATVNQLKNHPSICYWTIFNEGWGQFDSDAVYEQFRKLDASRFIDATSGWFRRKKSDVDSRHVYFRKVKLSGDGVKPLVLSEFGGKTFKAEGHVFDPEKTYGYGSCQSLETLNTAVSDLYLNQVLPCIQKGLCAAIYTQVSDVEDEINGVLSYDRKLTKLTPETMLPIAEALQKAIK